MDIATGGTLVAILNKADAKKLDLHWGDRIRIRDGGKETTCILDISESDKAVPEGRIGLFEEALRHLKVKQGEIVDIKFTGKPESVQHIRDKLHGKTLDYTSLSHIMDDITRDRLTDIEKTYFVAAGFLRGFSLNETVNMTKAMVNAGRVLKFRGVTLDKHCVGGVPGNRTTMLVVPIIAAAGFTIPKTSSRAITSPAGTADTMECLAKVELSEKKIKEVVRRAGACIIHGGSMNLAPADDKIIEVEHPLGIDAEGQLLASVMAKKYSVSANHVLIDIPMGPRVKAKTHHEAHHLKSMFEQVGKRLKMDVKVVITDGSHPIGNGIGPLLEANDVMAVLRNDPNAPQDLREKSLMLAGWLLEMACGCTDGRKRAEEILTSGKALKKMNQIIALQGKQKKILPAKFCCQIKAPRSGNVHTIDNEIIAKAARIAGAPMDKAAGLYLHKKIRDTVAKSDPLYTVFAESKFKLELALEFVSENNGYLIH